MIALAIVSDRRWRGGRKLLAVRADNQKEVHNEKKLSLQDKYILTPSS